MANMSHNDVVSAFEKRYDFQSARNVLNQALKAGGLGAKDSYSDAELGKIGDALKELGEPSIEGLIEALAAGGGNSKGGDAKAASKADDKKGDDKKADAKKDDKKDDKKAASKKKK